LKRMYVGSPCMTCVVLPKQSESKKERVKGTTKNIEKERIEGKMNVKRVVVKCVVKVERYHIGEAVGNNPSERIREIVVMKSRIEAVRVCVKRM